MSIYDNYSIIGKNTITATRSEFTKLIGDDGIKDIIKKVFLGGNVRDITEFITQRRLLNSYASTLELFTNTLYDDTKCISEYTSKITNDLINSKGNAKILDLWLLGLTKKGLDNIVRDESNIKDYQSKFSSLISETIDDLTLEFGELSGNLLINGKKIELNWNILSLLFIALGSQTLTIRGSSKSMNGKLFEKLVLGSLLSISGFKYCKEPPKKINQSDKIFWLSNMDENEREVDATIVYNCMAISIDIGFIGKGNPEITLDKVTRFGSYKEIGGINHNMSTIIIVDTVGENSDLFNKAHRVNGSVLQMKDNDWVLQFIKLICEKFNITHDLLDATLENLEDYLSNAMNLIDVNSFIN